MNELIHPEVRAELERLGVDDLPWEAGAICHQSLIRVWNDALIFTPGRELCFLWSRYRGESFNEHSPWWDEFKRFARARYSPTDDKPPETPSTAFEKVERLLSHMKPSNVSDTRRELLGSKDEVGLLRLAVTEGMPDYRKTTREKHEAVCAALVMLRETLARTGLTHADKDAVILAAAEKLEEAL